MQYQNQNIISYLESENTPTVNLSVFKKLEKNKKIVKDIKDFSDRADKIKTIQKTVTETVIDDKDSFDIKQKNESLIERRVRPLNVDFLSKKKNDVTWL